MAMQVGPAARDDAPMTEINVVPLIDVMLVLLIMLIITLPIQTHAVKLDMPQADKPPPLVPPQVVDITVDFDGTVIWNGAPVESDRALQRYLLDIGRQDVELQAEIHLRPHRLVTYQHVAHVLATAQRLGVVKIGIVGNEQFL